MRSMTVTIVCVRMSTLQDRFETVSYTIDSPRWHLGELQHEVNRSGKYDSLAFHCKTAKSARRQDTIACTHSDGIGCMVNMSYMMRRGLKGISGSMCVQGIGNLLP